ncbi:tripartite tricarboxylate transporter substrate binding protein [Xanthomonas axonopodis]|uniref:tripartite tricarboxylate transporter substrate binding protein n=1 Tax=Xanthomonas axonopodis TaxID=53413 RepID=UPI00355762D7
MFLKWTCMSVLALAAPAALAEANYPARPITIVVGFAPGGITDIFARLLGQEASRILKQPVIVDNKPGAAGIIASDMVARSTPDGYTLLMTANNHIINAVLRPNSKVDIAKDFTPITLLASTPNILAVGSDSPYQSLKAYVEAAKAKPEAVSYASSGIGTSPHFAGAHFASLIGAKMVHVPYKSSNESMMAAISGEVDSVWSAAALQQIKAGKLKPLAIASEPRFALAPAIPTFAEQGFADVHSEVWVGLLGPKNLPHPIAQTWDDIMQKLLVDPGIRKAIENQAYQPILGVSQRAFGARITQEINEFKKIATQSQITME